MAQLTITWGYLSNGVFFTESTVFPEEFGETVGAGLTPIVRAPLSGPIQHLVARITATEGAVYAGIGSFEQAAINYAGPGRVLYVGVQRGDYIRAIETEPLDLPGGPGTGPSNRFNVSVYAAGPLDSEETLLRYVFTFPVKFPAGAVDSRAIAADDATDDVTIKMSKNGTPFGTVVVDGEGNTGTFTQAADVTFGPNDVLMFYLEDPDDTLADLTINLVGDFV